MIDQLKQLEHAARSLEPHPLLRQQLQASVTAHGDAFLDSLANAPAYRYQTEQGDSSFDPTISEEGSAVEAALAFLSEAVDISGINLPSGRMLGYIPGGGIFHSALGDYLAAITNRYSGHFFAAPGAVRLENVLLRWMAELIGYPDTSAGNLTTGGSLAHLTAIVTARDDYDALGEDCHRFVVYLTEHTHHSVHKSLHIAGLDKCLTRSVPVDNRYRLNPQALDKMVDADKKAGLIPWLIIASAGTTNTGAVDPLSAISDVADSFGCWLHIDGAYGALFALCEEARPILRGMDRSDSIIMDPHKTLFLPFGTGAVLVKNREALYSSFHWQADYTKDLPDDQDELSPADLSPELSRHFRGLRLWLPLKLLGLAPFRAALSEKILLARHFYEAMKKANGFEVGPYPDLSVVTYRYLPRRGNIDDFNQRLIQRVLMDGRVFITSTRVNGNFVLRLAVLGFRTHLDEIEEAIEILKRTARELEND